MNQNRRVFYFVLLSVTLYLIVSVAAVFLDWKWPLFQRVNLIADLFTKKEAPAPAKPIAAAAPAADSVPPEPVTPRPEKDFSLYQHPRLITDFHTDSLQPSMKQFVRKLYDLQTTRKGKVRIAYFGDSMIEGDLMTQTLRQLLQKTFGGSGVGFVPITSQVSQFRRTVAATYSDGWEDENFKEGKTSRLYLSGHLFRTPNAWVQLTDQTVTSDSCILEKSLICGPYASGTSINVNKNLIKINPDKPINRIILGKDNRRSIGVGIANKSLPVYGISFESESGIFVDNFSFRGITGIELAGIDSTFLCAINEQNPYDLIIFQYGVNLLFRPNDKNFKWYGDFMRPIIRKMKNCFPASDFLLVSTADRAFRYNGKYQSAIGIDSLVKVQAGLAFETGSNFYNQFASMGGVNSIVDWAKAKPSLANQDHVHPNARGAEILANYFYEAIQNEYEKYTRSLIK